MWINYHGPCTAGSSRDIPLELLIDSDTQGAKIDRNDALPRVRAMLRGGERFSLRSASGIINVNTPDVWTPILDMKLNGLSFKGDELYNPNWIITSAIRASQTSLDALRATPLTAIGSLLGEYPSKGRPHIKKSSKYNTLNDLLVDVSRTFRGVLVYKECRLEDNTHLFDIHFYRQ